MAAITPWVRLRIGDLPILWTGAGREYNPDFNAVGAFGVHWVIEVKMDKGADVRAPESDVVISHGSWLALAQLGGHRQESDAGEATWTSIS